MVQGTSATGLATITLIANVTSVGTYTIFTNTVNGVNFSANGTFTTTGNQTVTLVATGTPTLAGNYLWVTNLNPNINVYGSVITTNAPLGSSYDAHFNGIIGGTHIGLTPSLISQTTGETFNNNTTCLNKPISAQGCAGVDKVVASSGMVHLTVNINGQCWLKTNLITVPTVYNTYTSTSWNQTSPNDQGYWGYYNTNTTNGSSGWSGSVPATGEGLLYQWCGAMDATISERSRGICPAGFHIPSDCEWMFLEHGLGMSITEQNNNNTPRANIVDEDGLPGYKLGNSIFFPSGFDRLLAGYREINGSFNGRSSYGHWWTSSGTGAPTASSRSLFTGARGVIRNSSDKANGYSVRCLKD